MAEIGSGNAQPKRKPGSMAVLVDNGLVKEGDLLRYITVRGVLLGIGFVHQNGIRVPKVPKPLGFSAFEKHVGGKAHRPCEFTFTSTNTKLQDLFNKGRGPSTVKPAEKALAAPVWGVTKSAGHDLVPAALTEDLNDEYCRICWQGGDLLCCESCPSVYHRECLRLDVVPDGDWHCPLCVCATCAHPNFGPRLKLEPFEGKPMERVIWVTSPEGAEVYWSGKDAFKGLVPVVTMHAEGFDRAWPEEGSRIAATQKMKAKLKVLEAPSEDASQGYVGSKRKAPPLANGRQQPWSDAMPWPGAKSSGGSLRKTSLGSLTKPGEKLLKRKAAEPRNKPAAKRPQLVTRQLLVGMAKEAASPDELSRKLTTWAEEIAAENPESDPMRHVFNLLCPDLVYKKGEGTLFLLSGLLWNMRDGEIEEEEGNDETGEQSAKRKRMDTDDSHDSSTFVHRSRRPEPGLPKRFLDAVMLSEEEGSDSDVWVPRSLRAAQGGSRSSGKGRGRGRGRWGGQAAGPTRRRFSLSELSLSELFAKAEKLQDDLRTRSPTPAEEPRPIAPRALARPPRGPTAPATAKPGPRASAPRRGGDAPVWEPRAAGAGEGEGLSSAGVTGQRAGRVELSSESSDVDIEGQFTPSVMVPEQTPIFLPGPSSPSSNPASAAPSRPADGDELGAAPPGGSRGGLSNLGRDGTAAQPGGLASNSLARPQVKVEGDRRDLGAETLGAGGLHRAAAREVSTEVDGRGGGQSLQTSAPSLAHVLQGFPNLAASLASIVSPEQAAISFRLMQVLKEHAHLFPMLVPSPGLEAGPPKPALQPHAPLPPTLPSVPPVSGGTPIAPPPSGASVHGQPPPGVPPVSGGTPSAPPASGASVHGRPPPSVPPVSGGTPSAPPPSAASVHGWPPSGVPPVSGGTPSAPSGVPPSSWGATPTPPIPGGMAVNTAGPARVPEGPGYVHGSGGVGRPVEVSDREWQVNYRAVLEVMMSTAKRLSDATGLPLQRTMTPRFFQLLGQNGMWPVADVQRQSSGGTPAQVPGLLANQSAYLGVPPAYRSTPPQQNGVPATSLSLLLTEPLVPLAPDAQKARPSLTINTIASALLGDSMRTGPLRHPTAPPPSTPATAQPQPLSVPPRTLGSTHLSKTSALSALGGTASAHMAASAQLLQHVKAEPSATSALQGVLATPGTHTATSATTSSGLASALMHMRAPAQAYPAASRAGPMPGVPSQGRPLAAPGVPGPQGGAQQWPAPGTASLPQNKAPQGAPASTDGQSLQMAPLLAGGRNSRDPRLQYRRPKTTAAVPPPQGLRPAAEPLQQPVLATQLPRPVPTPPVANNLLALASNYLAVDPSQVKGPAAMLREYLSSEKSLPGARQVPGQPSSLAAWPFAAQTGLRAPAAGPAVQTIPQLLRGTAPQAHHPGGHPAQARTHAGSGATPSGVFAAPPLQVQDDRARSARDTHHLGGHPAQVRTPAGSGAPTPSGVVAAPPLQVQDDRARTADLGGGPSREGSGGPASRGSTPAPYTLWQGPTGKLAHALPGRGLENGVTNVVCPEAHASGGQWGAVHAPPTDGHLGPRGPVTLREGVAAASSLSGDPWGPGAGVPIAGEARRADDAKRDNLWTPTAPGLSSGATPMETAAPQSVGGAPVDPHGDRREGAMAGPAGALMAPEQASVHVPSAQLPRALAGSCGTVESTLEAPAAPQQPSGAVQTLDAVDGGNTGGPDLTRAPAVQISAPTSISVSVEAVQRSGQVPGEQKQAGVEGPEEPPEGTPQNAAHIAGNPQQDSAAGVAAVPTNSVGGPPESPGEREEAGATAVPMVTVEIPVKVESEGEVRGGDGSQVTKQTLDGSQPTEEAIFDNVELAKRTELLLRDLSPPPLPAPERLSRKGLKRARQAPAWLVDEEDVEMKVECESKPVVLYEAPLHPRMDDFESLPRQPWQSPAKGPAPEGDAAREVDCPTCMRRFHKGCLPAEAQQQVEGEVWFCSSSCRGVSNSLAKACMRGVVALSPLEDGTPVGWQLVQGAAVAAPQVCRGYAPGYHAEAKKTLRKVLHAARHVAADIFAKVQDTRSLLDLLPAMLAGRVSGDRTFDFSSFHTAVLWVGGTFTSFALVRVLGAEVAELPIIATRRELRGNGLARILLRAVEATLIQAGCKMVIMPSTVVFPPPRRTVGVAAQQATLPVPWPLKAGYEVMGMRQAVRITGLPLLSFPGNPLLSKELLEETLTEGGPAKRLALYPGCPAQALARANVLVAAAAHTTTSPKADAANPASALPPKVPASSTGPGGKPPKAPPRPAVVAEAAPGPATSHEAAPGPATSHEAGPGPALATEPPLAPKTVPASPPRLNPLGSPMAQSPVVGSPPRVTPAGSPMAQSPGGGSPTGVTPAGSPMAQSPRVGSPQGEEMEGVEPPFPYWEQTGMTEEEWAAGTLLPIEDDT